MPSPANPIVDTRPASPSSPSSESASASASSCSSRPLSSSSLSTVSSSSSPPSSPPSIVLSDYDYDNRCRQAEAASRYPRNPLCCTAIATATPQSYRHLPAVHARPYRSLAAAAVATHSRYSSPTQQDLAWPSAFGPSSGSVAPLTEHNVLQLRSLTEPARAPICPARDNDAGMTTCAPPPGSPPGLTSSKSSKSSSFRSSTFSAADAGCPDFAHFEDIGLDDADDGDDNQPGSAYGASYGDGKGAQRHSAGSASSTKVNSPALSTRELVNGTARPSYPSPQASSPALSAAASRSALSLPLGVRKPLTRPTPLASSSSADLRRPSRSPSPAQRHRAAPASPRPIPGGSPAVRPGVSPLVHAHAGSRRGSSNRSRRTAAELEAECRDTDDDEDLPDEASLWNVPLSPSLYRAASSVASSSAAPSAAPSASTSPDRPHYLQAPAGGLPRDRPAAAASASSLSLASPARTVPLPPRAFSPVIDSVPASPISPRLPRAGGPAGGAALGPYAFGKARAKSWSNVLSDLSEEALSLSQALDEHAAENPSSPHGAAGSGSGWPRSPRRANSAFVELPPLRRGNVLIDPLPVSREKERVLSRTRPSWLPPKSQKEERRHLREYQKMMEHSLENDKRRAATAATARCARDDTAAALQRVWTAHVLPRWEAAAREPRTRELCWRGVPGPLRAAAWKRAVPNELGLTSATYHAALTRARRARNNATSTSTSATPPGDARDQHSAEQEHAWIARVDADVACALPALRRFQRGQPLHAALTDLLSAYALYRADVALPRGTAAIAAMLLLTFSAPSPPPPQPAAGPTPTDPSVTPTSTATATAAPSPTATASRSGPPPPPPPPPTADAFIALANLLNRPLPLAFATRDRSGMRRAGALMVGLLAAKRPRLHAHLFGPPAPAPGAEAGAAKGSSEGAALSEGAASSEGGLGLDPVELIAPLVQTLFMHRCCGESATPTTSTSASTSTPAATANGGPSLALARRLWDVVLFDGDAAVVRACAAALAAAEPALYGSRAEVRAALGWAGAGLGLGLGLGLGAAGGTGGGGPEGADEEEEEAWRADRFMRLVREMGKVGPAPTVAGATRGES